MNCRGLKRIWNGMIFHFWSIGQENKINENDRQPRQREEESEGGRERSEKDCTYPKTEGEWE